MATPRLNHTGLLKLILMQQQVGELVLERRGVGLGGEVAAFTPHLPMGPKPARYLLDAVLTARSAACRGSTCSPRRLWPSVTRTWESRSPSARKLSRPLVADGRGSRLQGHLVERMHSSSVKRRRREFRRLQPPPWRERVNTEPFLRWNTANGGSMAMSWSRLGGVWRRIELTVFPLLADGRFMVRRLCGRALGGLDPRSPRIRSPQ